MALEHGGDIRGFEEEYGFMPLDFSANVSPLGLPDGVRKAIVASLDVADAYPDPLSRDLVQAISTALSPDIAPGMVICGNGTSDIIYRLVLARRPARALLTAPTFSEYARALAVVGCDISYHFLREERGFPVEEDILSDIEPGTDIVFICQPNNPTGRTVDRTLLFKILARCEKVGALLVVDECFVGFCDDPASLFLTSLVAGHPSLFLLRAFTKLYGMAGIRLGYGLGSDAALIARMREVGQPWPISTMAQAAGVAALACDGYVEEVRSLVRTERGFIAKSLAGMGIDAMGEANYLFFDLDDGGRLAQDMRQRGVLVRDCSNFLGLRPGWYRIAVLSHGENLQMLDALHASLEFADRDVPWRHRMGGSR